MDGRWRRTLTLAIPLAALSALLGEAAAQENDSYRLGARDKVLIQVEEVPELDREFEVRQDGSILLPVLGTIEARGRTESELARELRTRLEEQGLRRATVSVRITGFFSRPVSVLGGVGKPGIQHVPGSSTLLEVLLAAGYRGDDSRQVIQVRRRAENGLSDTVTIRAGELFRLGDPAVNIPIFGGDVVFVPVRETIAVTLLGAVSSPGALELPEGTTLLIALARAGGLAEQASPKVRIRRREDGEVVELVANYRRILNGKDPDVELLEGDMVIVKESFF